MNRIESYMRIVSVTEGGAHGETRTEVATGTSRLFYDTPWQKQKLIVTHWVPDKRLTLPGHSVLAKG